MLWCIQDYKLPKILSLYMCMYLSVCPYLGICLCYTYKEGGRDDGHLYILIKTWLLIIGSTKNMEKILLICWMECSHLYFLTPVTKVTLLQGMLLVSPRFTLAGDLTVSISESDCKSTSPHSEMFLLGMVNYTNLITHKCLYRGSKSWYFWVIHYATLLGITQRCLLVAICVVCVYRSSFILF